MFPYGKCIKTQKCTIAVLETPWAFRLMPQADQAQPTNTFLGLDKSRVADVGGPRDRRSPKGQVLLRKEGPPTYAILSRNLVLSRFTRFMNGHHRAFYESHPTLRVFSTKVS